jgi:AcrR family transcriptional regulator
MPQVQKDEVRERIEAAALAIFAEQGFRGATMSAIAERADLAVANLYRYYKNKDALFDAVVPATLAEQHRVLLERSVRSLSFLAHGKARGGATAETDELLAFWVAHRLAVVVLLDRAAETPYADYGTRFVRQLVDLTVTELDTKLTREARQVLTVIFDNTRRAIATILESNTSERAIRDAITLFRSYQTGGLASLFASVSTSSRRASARSA